MAVAYVFPGQGSQTVGMGKALAENFPAARAVFAEVDEALGEKLSDIIFGGPAETLMLTENTQPALMAVSLATLRVLESASAEDGTIRPIKGETALFITPGYRFRTVDVLMTNFHLPRSTLFMLVAAFCGLDVIKRAYAHAIAAGYRFYSYGDACLLFRA